MKIEKNKPIPSKAHHRKKYKFDELKVDESFFVDGKTSSELMSAATSFLKRRKGTKIKFTARQEGSGARIWRIK